MPPVSRAGLAHLAIVALACISAGWTVQAQSEAMPAIQTQGGVRYACGGIGSDESAAMRAAMKQFPLSLLFARPDGGYLADVDVAILAADGRTVLAMRASGPVCLIDLPPGRYEVAAASGGVGKSHSVSIGSAPATADFRFER
jgi:hypothetical protein